ncbi:Uncharacterised protein [Moraxella caprae]|uniref:Uncharacterized protein n=1 Tax=Moraxella caprae TaxID=90240 RepID=A0A378U5G5_9GAMM|nr:Uncharacterised protein [Moraxella caprae]
MVNSVTPAGTVSLPFANVKVAPTVAVEPSAFFVTVYTGVSKSSSVAVPAVRVIASSVSLPATSLTVVTKLPPSDAGLVFTPSLALLSIVAAPLEVSLMVMA